MHISGFVFLVLTLSMPLAGVVQQHSGPPVAGRNGQWQSLRKMPVHDSISIPVCVCPVTKTACVVVCPGCQVTISSGYSKDVRTQSNC